MSLVARVRSDFHHKDERKRFKSSVVVGTTIIPFGQVHVSVELADEWGPRPSRMLVSHHSPDSARSIAYALLDAAEVAESELARQAQSPVNE